MGRHFGERTPNRLLELLGQLARYRNRTFGSENPGELLERLRQTVRRLVENHRTLFVGELQQALRPPFLGRQKTLETKTIAREAAVHKRRHESRSARQGLDFDPVLEASSHEQKTGIGNTRRAGIRHQRDRLARLDSTGNGLDGRMLVELMVTPHPLLDPQMSEQHLRGPRILGQNQVHVRKHPHGAQRDIVQVADRRGHHIELRHGSSQLSLRSSRSTNSCTPSLSGSHSKFSCM